MTIITTQDRVTYAGDNVSTVFPVPFEFFLNSDLTVVKTAVGGVQTTLVLGIDYSLTGANVAGGGSLTKTLALATGEILAIFLNPPITQQSHYQSNGPFPAATLENDLDRQTQISQRLSDRLGRTLSAPDGDVNPQLTLPSAALRAGLVQAYDSSGNVTLLPTAAFPTTAIVSATQFGAVGNGTTDDTVALNAAFASGAHAVYLPALNYRCAGNVSIPAGVSVYSFGFQPSNPFAVSQTGTRFTFDLSVAGAAVTLGGAGAANGACSLKGLSILRAAGAPPAGSIGLLVQNTDNAIVEDVACYSHQVPFKTQGDKLNSGVATMVNRLFTGAAYDAHIVIDTTPQVRFNQCIFGLDGIGDQNCDAFVRIQGGSTTNSANGPGTVVFLSTQFNQGTNVADKWVSWVNQTPGNIADVTDFTFNDCYVETVNRGLFSDATWTLLNEVRINNLLFNMGSSIPFWALNTATLTENILVGDSRIGGSWTMTGGSQINFMTIGDSIIDGAFVCSMTPQINFLGVNNCIFKNGVSLTGSAGSSAQLSNCQYINGLTTTGAWGYLGIDGGQLISGTFNHSATGLVYTNLGNFNAVQTWVPNVQFGGANVGVTYSVQTATVQRIGSRNFCDVVITLTSKGSSVGGATISNLPAPNGTVLATSGGGNVTLANNMTGLTGAISCEISSGVVNLYQSNATGSAAVTDANFTNTSTLKLTFSYSSNIL